MKQTRFCLIFLTVTKPVGLRTKFILTGKLNKHKFTVLTRSINQVHWVKIMRQFNGIWMCLLLYFNVNYVNNILRYGLDYRHNTMQNKTWLSIDRKMLTFVSICAVKYVCVSNLYWIYLADWILAYFLEYGNSYFWPIRSKKELGKS